MKLQLHLLALMPSASSTTILYLTFLVCKWEHSLLYKVVISFELGEVIWGVKVRALPIFVYWYMSCFRTVLGTHLVYQLPIALMLCNNHSQNFNSVQ